MLDLLSVVQNPSLYSVYFDNFFSSFGLFQELTKKGFQATGTVRENRLKKCPPLTNKELEKNGRGHPILRSIPGQACW